MHRPPPVESRFASAQSYVSFRAGWRWSRRGRRSWCAAGRRTSCTGAGCGAGPAPRCTGSQVMPALWWGAVSADPELCRGAGPPGSALEGGRRRTADRRCSQIRRQQRPPPSTPLTALGWGDGGGPIHPGGVNPVLGCPGEMAGEGFRSAGISRQVTATISPPPPRLGAKKWLEWRKEIELLSDVAYFVLTTLSGNTSSSFRFSISPTGVKNEPSVLGGC